MIRVCAWCGALLGEIEPLDDQSTTHGICPECADKVLAKNKGGAVTIDEAIKSLTLIKGYCARRSWGTDAAAVQLGIEALKFVRQYEADNLVSHDPVLPGEAKEGENGE